MQAKLEDHYQQLINGTILMEGKLEGELAVIMRLLTRRIGTVEPELQERIRQLSLEQLEDLAEALLDFSDEDDLVVWLQRVSDESEQEE